MTYENKRPTASALALICIAASFFSSGAMAQKVISTPTSRDVEFDDISFVSPPDYLALYPGVQGIPHGYLIINGVTLGSIVCDVETPIFGNIVDLAKFRFESEDSCWNFISTARSFRLANPDGRMKIRLNWVTQRVEALILDGTGNSSVADGFSASDERHSGANAPADAAEESAIATAATAE